MDLGYVANVSEHSRKEFIVDRTGKSTCCFAGTTTLLVTKTRRHFGGHCLAKGVCGLPRMEVWVEPKFQTHSLSVRKL